MTHIYNTSQVSDIQPSYNYVAFKFGRLFEMIYFVVLLKFK